MIMLILEVKHECETMYNKLSVCLVSRWLCHNHSHLWWYCRSYTRMWCETIYNLLSVCLILRCAWYYGGYTRMTVICRDIVKATKCKLWKITVDHCDSDKLISPRF